MGSFSKQIPLNSDSSLGPVTIGSKIMVERGKDPLPLEGGNVDLVPGSGWDGSTVSISKEMNQAGNKLDILVKLAPELSLAHYLNVIVKKKPIKMKVTLFPKMLVPGMGIPVSVSAAPIADDVAITIPAVPRPDIDLDVKFTGKTSSGSYTVLVTALVKLPPYISKKDRDEVAKKITIDLKKPINVSVEKGELTPDEAGATCELTATPDFTKKGTPSVTVVAKVSLPDITLKKEKLVSFEPQRNYILNIHPASLDVKKNKAASLTAQVLQVLGEDQKVLVTDARLSIDGGSDLISCSPDKGTGKLECKVSQQKVTREKQVSITVQASAGTDSVKPQTVPVRLETIDYGTLAWEFSPPEKNHLNPYIKNDEVVIKAKLVPPVGKDPVKADIEFSREVGGWLAGPNSPDTVDTADGDNVKTAMFTGNLTYVTPDKIAPSSESVLVRVTVEDTMVIEEPIPVLLDPKPTLTAEPATVNFLANAKRIRPGRPEAIISALVKLSVHGPGDEEWKIFAELDEAAKKLVTRNEQDKTSSTQVFLFEMIDNIPLPERKPGVAAWQQVVTVKTTATLGDLKIEGDPVTINILHEGLYPEQLSEYDKAGDWHDVTKEGKITINVYDPAEARAPLEDVDDVVERHIFPYVTFTVMEWDGTGLSRNENLFISYNEAAEESNDTGRAGSWWNTIFLHLKESFIKVIYSGDLEKQSTGKWHIIFQKQIPGKGEKANGYVRFYVRDYSKYAADNQTINWQYELPITLMLGNPDELKIEYTTSNEIARLDRIIRRCFPEEYRDELWDELKKLKGQGAQDYRVFSRKIHETANEKWARDKLDFLIWDTVWGVQLFELQAVEFFGDLAFNALVMFYTAGLGPYASFAISNFVSTIQSESKAVYAYYIQNGNGRDFPTCIEEYVNNNWLTFLINMASSETIETYYMGSIEIEKVLKEPRKYTKIVGFLWLWKFQLHLAGDIGKPADDRMGYCGAAYAATQDLGMLSINLLVGTFVQKRGTDDVKFRFGEVQERGAFGGEVVSPPGKKKSEKGDSDQAVKDKKAAEEKAAKDKADKDKQPGKDKTDKDKQSDKDKEPDKDKTDKDKTDKDKKGGNRTPEQLKEFGEGSGKPITDPKFTEAGKEPDLNGISDFHRKALEKIAAEMDVIPIMRPFGDQYGHVARGEANPKITMIHEKTINPIDNEYLGFGGSEADKGYAACKNPDPPDRPAGMKETDPQWKDIQDRYKQRKEEYEAFEGHLTELEKQGKIDWDRKTGIIYAKNRDGSRGKPFSGDNDPFAYIDAKTGKPLSPERNREFATRLHQVGVTMHSDHVSWDYTSPHEHNANTKIDDAILNGHSEIKGYDKNGNPKQGTPLNRYNPKTGKWDTVWWAGGLRK